MFCISVHVPNHLITFPFYLKRALLELTTKIAPFFDAFGIQENTQYYLQWHFAKHLMHFFGRQDEKI
jgi:hypothetical protein